MTEPGNYFCVPASSETAGREDDPAWRCLAWSLCWHVPGCGKVFKILGAACAFAVEVLLKWGHAPLPQTALGFIPLMGCGGQRPL